MILAAAGEALGNFANSKAEVRKRIVDIMIAGWKEIVRAGAPHPSPDSISTGHERTPAQIISGSWNDSLRALTRQSFEELAQWQSWSDKNRAQDWK